MTVEQKIAKLKELIPSGKENAISRDTLSNLMNLTDRGTRRAIEAARKQGLIIVNSQDGAGYFIANTEGRDDEEIQHQYFQEYKRALSILSSLKRTRQYLRSNGYEVTFPSGEDESLEYYFSLFDGEQSA